MNMLITGSSGFIGKNLKRYLCGKYNLLTPRSDELDLTEKNAVKNYFANNHIDIIIHCASVGGIRELPDSDTTIENNLAMVDNLLLYKNSDTRIILFGSGAMYNKLRDLHKVSETEIGNVIPEDLYGKSKLLIANKIKDRTDVTCLNIFACYGYGEKESRFPSYAIKQAINGDDIIINQNAVFDYLFVEDMQKIVEYFITNPPVNNIINITPSKSISLLEIAKIVKYISGKNINIKIINPKMNNEYTGDNNRLLKEIPSIIFTEMETGLKKLYDYINDNKKFIV